MHTHFVVRADDDDSPFGQIRQGETFDFHGLIMYRLGEDGQFADIKVAYLSFIYTDVNGTAKDLRASRTKSTRRGAGLERQRSS